MKRILTISIVIALSKSTIEGAKTTTEANKKAETPVNKHFDFSDFFGGLFGGQQPGGQNPFPGFNGGQTNNGGFQPNQNYFNQFPNQNPGFGQSPNNQNQWQNPNDQGGFDYPNQDGRPWQGEGQSNNQPPWQNGNQPQQNPNNAGQMPNQGQTQNQTPNFNGNQNNLDWKNYYPNMNLNQPPQSAQRPGSNINDQGTGQGQNSGSNQFPNQVNRPRPQTPVVPTSPQQSQNAGQNPNNRQPSDGSIDSIVPEIPSSEAQSVASTPSPTQTQCQQNCPSTPEYNPVCGINNVTYSNPGNLLCARKCGLAVTLKHRGRCAGDSANRFL